MLNDLEKEFFTRLFNRHGYVLDFSTPSFDAFTKKSIGVPLCEHYGLSKGQSLEAYISEANDSDAKKLLFDLFDYYEAFYAPEYDNTQSGAFDPAVHERNMGGIYRKCLEIRDRERASEERGESITTEASQHEGPCTVFISHASSDRAYASQLRDELERYGIESIVAHDDIAISADWCLELERLLSCCDALVYLATYEANQSPWCQQEVGWALGRGIPVVAIIVGCVPVAFMGRHQALSGGNASMVQVSQRVIKSLLVEERLTNTLVDSLLGLLGQSDSYNQSNTLAHCLTEAPGITREQAQLIERIIADNDQVRNANWGRLPETLRELKIVD